MIKTILIDNRNFEQYAFKVIEEVKAASFIGFDIETHDDNRHEGLNTYCNYDPVTRKKAATSKLVFDINRTVMTGFSLYPENADAAYYVNLNHADVENRLSWEKARLLIDAIGDDSHMIIHNASFELTNCASCYGLEIKNYICTLQMAVSSFGPDEYDIDEFVAQGRGDMGGVFDQMIYESKDFDAQKPDAMSPQLAELVYKVIAKESKAAHSYNGFVKAIAYTYGLKKLVAHFFHHQMTTFDQVLDGKAHMGLLTGEEVAAYGAEDAYWAVRLFRHLMTYMAATSPGLTQTFLEQENPMSRVYSDIWLKGLKVNTAAIQARRDTERAQFANILREMKAVTRSLLPFKPQPVDSLSDESWYVKNYAKYRKQIEDWTNSPDTTDDYIQARQVRGAVSNAWSIESGHKEPTAVNLSHYMPIRVLIYDLLATKVIKSDGKVQSDGEARGRIKDRMEREERPEAVKLLEGLNEMAGVEQRMKLYLTPYNQLMDPDTGRMYPVVSSMLASRRMAASYPNPMQLAKRGESTYVRGFFEADYDDHVIVSIDWSAIELVEIGEFSGDPAFIQAFGQIPHDDLHAGAAADILAVEVPGLTEASFKSLKQFKQIDDFRDHHGQDMANYNRLFTDLKGGVITDPSKAYKYWRTEVGKGANFNYWYSGFLSTIGERMGWDMHKTGEATERYRNRFAVAEQWRVDLINEGKANGFVTLPDHHRRVRFEATARWHEYFTQKFMHDNAAEYNNLVNYIARKIQGRANNQLVNSMIQGSCATIAKRSILRINEKLKNAGWTDREARFMIPIHDELVFSVHKDRVAEFIGIARGTMIDHPDMFKHCKLDASPSVGLTFEPWDEKKAPFGQIELFEAPNFDWLPTNKWGGRLNDDEVQGVVEHLFEKRKIAA